jgi:hypothetical protein
MSNEIHFPQNLTSVLKKLCLAFFFPERTLPARCKQKKKSWLISPIFSCLKRIIGVINQAFLELLSVFFFSSKNLAKRVQGSACCCSNNKIKSYKCLFFCCLSTQFIIQIRTPILLQLCGIIFLGRQKLMIFTLY